MWKKIRRKKRTRRKNNPALRSRSKRKLPILDPIDGKKWFRLGPMSESDIGIQKWVEVIAWKEPIWRKRAAHDWTYTRHFKLHFVCRTQDFTPKRWFWTTRPNCWSIYRRDGGTCRSDHWCTSISRLEESRSNDITLLLCTRPSQTYQEDCSGNRLRSGKCRRAFSITLCVGGNQTFSSRRIR